MADRDAKGRHRAPVLGDRAARGERSGKAKLTAAQVVQIRAKRADGLTLLAIASQFGVSASAIDHIVARRNWKHIS